MKTKPIAKPNGWEQEFDKRFVGQDTKPHFGDWLTPKNGKIIKNFIHQAILSAEERAREEERERILDDGHLWFETHFTPEDPDDGIFTGIQEHMGEREFIKVVQDQATQNINNLDKEK